MRHYAAASLVVNQPPLSKTRTPRTFPLSLTFTPPDVPQRAPLSPKEQSQSKQYLSTRASPAAPEPPDAGPPPAYLNLHPANFPAAMSTADFNTLFSRLQQLSLTSSLPATLPDPSLYDYLAAASDSQFIYFTRLSRSTPSSSLEQDLDEQQYYVPFFTDNFHTLLHEIANYYELENGVGDIKGLSLKAEGTESDGKFTELDLGLDGIRAPEQWELAKVRLGEMGFGSKTAEGTVQMGEGIVVVVDVA
ncbi:hypothetical protein BDZ91DRAFT_784285 [Kalaharituber pfeilii]|nr:hypothetical protein BDZ91DRAFT_784285 [Kalaharituber pfeilii]